MNSNSGRDNTNSGSDSAIHHGRGSAFEQHSRARRMLEPSHITTGPNGNVVRDERPTKADPRSAAK